MARTATAFPARQGERTGCIDLNQSSVKIGTGLQITIFSSRWTHRGVLLRRDALADNQDAAAVCARFSAKLASSRSRSDDDSSVMSTWPSTAKRRSAERASHICVNCAKGLAGERRGYASRSRTRDDGNRCMSCWRRRRRCWESQRVEQGRWLICECWRADACSMSRSFRQPHWLPTGIMPSTSSISASVPSPLCD